MAFIGLVISTIPYLVPPSLTAWQAAAARGSRRFILSGMVVLIRMILGCTVFVYRTLRVKVRPGQGYPREDPKGPRELTAAKLARRVPLRLPRFEPRG